MLEKKIIIAIDGFSSCGKSTMAKSLARELGYIYIDSGAMYRAVTLYALRNKWITNGIPNIDKIINAINDISITFRFDPQTEKNTTFLNGENIEEEIRKKDVSDHVSPVSAIKEVRSAMVKLQKKMGAEKGIVMDGRDIGTVVFPEAELKIFMTADPDVRARRRYLELTLKGENTTLEEVRENIEKRDHIDQTRKESPLRKAEDALVLDNSYLNHMEQLIWAIEKVKILTGS
jgi:cytidylate kinase